MWGCSTDVELNAPYKPFTIVFGVLDPGLDTQYVRINKTWLGEGNNLDYAVIRDSSEYDYDEFVATIGKYNNGNLQEEWILDSITRYDKDTDGIFFGPAYSAYYFVPENGLDQSEDVEYRLNIDFDSKDPVSAVSNVVDFPTNNSNILQPPPGVSSYTLNLANVTELGTHYNNFVFKWNSSPNSGRYEVSLNFHYTENLWADDLHTDLISSTDKVINWSIGSVTSPTDGVAQLTKEVNWEAFYQMLSNRLEADSKITRKAGIWNAEEQTLGVFDLILTIGNDELSTFLEVNEPVTGIIQERPEYTNIVNGLGLFASRGQQIVRDLGISNNSIAELVEGDKTFQLNFCSGNPFSDYACD